MTVSFSVARRDEVIDKNCCICLESFENAKFGEVVVHDGSLGNLHPMHKECIKQWLERSSECPLCKAVVNNDSLFSWKDRIVSIGAEIAIAFVGGICGAILEKKIQEAFVLE